MRMSRSIISPSETERGALSDSLNSQESHLDVVSDVIRSGPDSLPQNTPQLDTPPESTLKSELPPEPTLKSELPPDSQLLDQRRSETNAEDEMRAPDRPGERPSPQEFCDRSDWEIILTELGSLRFDLDRLRSRVDNGELYLSFQQVQELLSARDEILAGKQAQIEIFKQQLEQKSKTETTLLQLLSEEKAEKQRVRQELHQSLAAERGEKQRLLRELRQSSAETALAEASGTTFPASRPAEIAKRRSWWRLWLA